MRHASFVFSLHRDSWSCRKQGLASAGGLLLLLGWPPASRSCHANWTGILAAAVLVLHAFTWRLPSFPVQRAKNFPYFLSIGCRAGDRIAVCRAAGVFSFTRWP